MQMQGPQISLSKPQQIQNLSYSQFKSEVLELKNKEKDYNLLSIQIVELENKFQTLNIKKDQQLRDRKQIEESLVKELEELKHEIKECKKKITEKAQINDKNQNELTLLKNLVDSQSKEVLNLNGKLEELNKENDKIHTMNKIIIDNIDNEKQTYSNLQIEVLNRKKNIEIEDTQRFDKINQMNLLEIDIQKECNINCELIHELETINSEKNSFLIEADSERKSKDLHKKEHERMIFQNSKLIREKNCLIEKENELEADLNNLEKKVSDAMNLLDAKDKTIEDYKKKITSEEILNAELNDEIILLKK